MRFLKYFIDIGVMLTLVLVSEMSAQSTEVYLQDTLRIESKILEDTLNLSFYKPETLELSNSEVKYPVVIVFDSQHQMTYPRIINSFDFLTIEALIPESLIIGIPFTYQNRHYLTSASKKDGDTSMGLELMEQFLFEELIPKLKSSYKATDFLVLIGHSRTAFLVNYLLTKQSDAINIAAAYSGFYKEFPLDEGAFESYLSNGQNFPNRTQYFITAGTSLEETSYKKQYDDLNSYLLPNKKELQLEFNYTIHPNATHMVNYWMSVPQTLLNGFMDYGKIINDWLFIKLEDPALLKPLDTFKSDLKALNTTLNLKANPSITHIISFANFYLNHQKYQTAVDFLEFGLDYFPDYLDFYPLLIELYELQKDERQLKTCIDTYISKVNKATNLSDSEKADRLKDF